MGSGTQLNYRVEESYEAFQLLGVDPRSVQPSQWLITIYQLKTTVIIRLSRDLPIVNALILYVVILLKTRTRFGMHIGTKCGVGLNVCHWNVQRLTD